MAKLRALLKRVISYSHRNQRDAELAAELESHLQFHIEDNLRAGMSPEEARRQALIKLGGLDQTKESVRNRRGLLWLDSLAQDARFAIRSLRRSRGFAIMSILVLGFAIGANVAMFSILNEALFKALPYTSPNRLAMLWTTNPGENSQPLRTAYWNIEQWASGSKSFVGMAAFDPGSATLTTADLAEKVSVLHASPELFPVLGIHMLRGRPFSMQDAAQQSHVAVISGSFWQTHFGRSRSALGSEIVIDDVPTQVIGVLPANLQFPEGDIWEPQTIFPDWQALRTARGSGSWFVIGRLAPGISIPQAQAEMNALASRIGVQLPPTQRDQGISVTPLRAYLAGPGLRLALWTLTGALLCVLLIASANTAGLWLARSTVRRKELAVRVALGASYSRIAAQLIVECFTLSILAGLVGLLLAQGIIRVAATMPGIPLSGLSDISLDLRAFLCALVLCAVSAVIVGLASSIPVVRQGFELSALRSRQSGAGTSGSQKFRGVLLISEFALTTVLLVGAGLLTRSVWSAESVALGFRPERLLSVQLSATALSQPGERTDLYNRVLAQMDSLPGVASAAIIEDFFTPSVSEQSLTAVTASGTVSLDLQFRMDTVSPEFFTTVGAPLLKGRLFSSGDDPQAHVAIINERAARLIWQSANPIGRKFKFGPAASNAPWFTVVGLVGDMRRQRPENDPIPQIFEPLNQDPPRLATLLVRSSVDDPLSLLPSIRAAVARVNRYIPLYRAALLRDQLNNFLAQRRLQSWLTSCFSVFALFMAAIGIYGLIQYSVVLRTHEIGVRIAVGAQRADVLRLILSQGIKIAGIGLLFGIVGSWAATRLIARLLYGVGPTDPFTFFSVSLILVAVALLACYIPALRATRIDPASAMRSE